MMAFTYGSVVIFNATESMTKRLLRMCRKYSKQVVQDEYVEGVQHAPCPPHHTQYPAPTRRPRIQTHQVKWIPDCGRITYQNFFGSHKGASCAGSALVEQPFQMLYCVGLLDSGCTG